MNTCKECRNAKNLNSGLVECHAKPPQVFLLPNRITGEPGSITVFPVISQDEMVCLLFKPGHILNRLLEGAAVKTPEEPGDVKKDLSNIVPFTFSD